MISSVGGISTDSLGCSLCTHCFLFMSKSQNINSLSSPLLRSTPPFFFFSPYPFSSSFAIIIILVMQVSREHSNNGTAEVRCNVPSLLIPVSLLHVSLSCCSCSADKKADVSKLHQDETPQPIFSFASLVGHISLISCTVGGWQCFFCITVASVCVCVFVCGPVPLCVCVCVCVCSMTSIY